MSRSSWKNFFIHFNFLKKSLLNKNQVPVWSRSSTIPKIFINKKVLINNGKTFKKVYITKRKIFFKFGEFCQTRGKFSHKNKNKLKPIKKGVKNIIKKK